MISVEVGASGWHRHSRRRATHSDWPGNHRDLPPGDRQAN